jgi:ribosomal protein S18 acetylase RimI-like enzyme
VTIAYRSCGREDAEALDSLFRKSFCDTFAHLYRPEDLEAFLGKFTREAWEAELSDARYSLQLAEADGVPVGYVKLGPPELPVETCGPAIEIRQFYLLHECHGTGIAHALMDWAMEEARVRGAREMYLTVFTENHRARRFYERFGFEVVGSYKFMVGSQADEDIIMRACV